MRIIDLRRHSLTPVLYAKIPYAIYLLRYFFGCPLRQFFFDRFSCHSLAAIFFRQSSYANVLLFSVLVVASGIPVFSPYFSGISLSPPRRVTLVIERGSSVRPCTCARALPHWHVHAGRLTWRRRHRHRDPFAFVTLFFTSTRR